MTLCRGYTDAEFAPFRRRLEDLADKVSYENHLWFMKEKEKAIKKCLADERKKDIASGRPKRERTYRAKVRTRIIKMLNGGGWKTWNMTAAQARKELCRRMKCSSSRDLTWAWRFIREQTGWFRKWAKSKSSVM